MLRRLSLIAVAWLLVSCSSNGCPSATCPGGITFNVAEVAGALARGSDEQLHICLDGTCHDTTVSRANAGGSIFVAFEGVGNGADHDLTVTGIGSLKGEYKGKLASYDQKPNGASCPGSCALATVKIAADGTLIPGVPKAPVTTVAGSPTTVGVPSPT